MFIHLTMFNNKFGVFIDVISLRSLFQKASKKGLCYSVLCCCLLGILIYNVSFEDNTNFRGIESFATTTTTSSSANNNVKETAADNHTANPTNPDSLSLYNPSIPPLLPLTNETQDGEDKRDLSLGAPFYDSKSSILLNKLDLIGKADPSSKISKELQIFYEMGIIYDSETVHNIGYYIEESKPQVSFNESSFDKSMRDSQIDETITFAKGTGFFIATDSDRIGWNAYDQVYDNSQGITKYLGVIYFSENEIPGGKLSDFANKAGIYEYELYADGSAHRNIWLWPTS